MARPSITLAFDTSGPYVAVALMSGDISSDGRTLVAEGRTLLRGQSEVLFPMCAGALSTAGLTWGDVTCIAVGIGPGNFTGTRIAVAAARGLSLGLGVPAVGVSAFEVLVERCQRHAGLKSELFSIAAPRGQAYVQPFAAGVPQGPGRVIDPAEPPGDLGAISAVYGHAASLIGAALGVRAFEAEVCGTPDQIAETAVDIARVAARKSGRDAAPIAPAPMYLRGADAAPPSDPPVSILA